MPQATVTPKKIKDLCDLKCLGYAFEYFDGNKSEFARAMKTSNQNVQNWVKRGTIPASKALYCERITGGSIKARDILIENESLEFGGF